MKTIIYIISIFMVITITSCSKFLDVNDNPNQPINENLPLNSKLPANLVNTVNLESGDLNLIGSFWSGYLGTTSEGVGLYNDIKSYNGLRIRLQREGIKIWEQSYINLEQYRLMEAQAQNENNPFYSGVAKVMQGMLFIRLVDLYNNVPFDEALQGASKPNPAYEDGKVVYQKSIDKITAGIEELKKVKNNFSENADIIFKGNVKRWIKLANTIKLRALITQSETNNTAYIKTEMAKITAEGSGFLGNAESALLNPGYLNTAGKLNPVWESYYRNVQNVATGAFIDLRPTQFYIDQLAASQDPRLAQLFVALNGKYKGVLFGNKSADPIYKRAVTSTFKGPFENDDKSGGLFKSYNQPLVLLSDFESLFLQTEAVQRGWLVGDVNGLYQQAIKASMSYLGVSADTYKEFLISSLAQLNLSSNKIESIINQKWRALYFINGLQSWNDYRRLGFPEIPNSLSAPTATARPLRLMYPESEIGTNPIQVQKQGSDDMFTQHVWWDVTK